MYSTLKYYNLCYKRIYKGGYKDMAEENSPGGNAVWAIALIIIVAIIAGVIYFGGFLNSTQKKEIDVEINVPSR
jgi:hypothetical protein